MKNIWKKFSRELGIIIALLILIAVFGIIEPLYLTPANLLDIIDQSVINGLLAIGITLVIISGGIDLTVGSSMAIVIVVMGNFLVRGLHPVVAIILGIAIGLLLGGINGFLIAKMKLQPFIATLGMMSVYRGIAYLVTGGWPVLNIPSYFRNMMDGDIGGVIPSSIVIFLIATAIGFVLLKYVKFGTYLYSIGSNEEATLLSGVNVDFNKIMAYALCGVSTALAGMVLLAKLGTGEPAAGQGYELNAIAAAAVGGTSLSGGKGTMLGTFFGAILLQALKVGLVVLGVDTFWQYIATGVIIIVAVYLDIVQEKFKTWKLIKQTA
ncbi:ribose ABC transporter (permease) [Petrocella atlantisensis]|uniref:Ribose ABC transporter (Permease) n=1 Tax=Petrocella atlantisensis TaxID=2173034 RepID=A0A3P7PCA9_9FIRM|nr:ABC transporter permease [Petrocella atlantisensis]PKM53824.1 MAG: ribose ABC transporter permease [Firmicutes bacterium HGW-Firmicutes-5]VDN47793.1 ribose ABC transporter (permease) [Petrocella atlantisensis]